MSSSQIQQSRNKLPPRFSFGATSALITNLGLITGLNTATNAKLSIVGSLLIIAIADNISDSLGIHIFQESEYVSVKDVWLRTITNFITRLAVSLLFVLIILVFPLKLAVILSLALGLFILTIMSYIIARERKTNALPVIAEHLIIAIAVIIASDFLGQRILSKFKLN